MSTLIISIFLALFLSLQSLKAAPNSRIVGGQEAEPLSIPYQVFLELYRGTDDGWYCSGSLISENYIITSAHCAYGADTAHITLGIHNRSKIEDTQVKMISTEMIVHEEWDAGYLLNDIALIKLPQSVTFTNAIRPVRLTTDVNSTHVGEIAKISGWGYLRGDIVGLSDVLNYVEAPVIPIVNCSREFLGWRYVTLNNVCTSGKGEIGACDGDNGGPMTIDDVLIGIVSFWMDYCLPDFPSVFTRIASYLDWIADNTDIVF